MFEHGFYVIVYDLILLRCRVMQRVVDKCNVWGFKKWIDFIEANVCVSNGYNCEYEY